VLPVKSSLVITPTVGPSNTPVSVYGVGFKASVLAG
jgi:hypothetical protein